jgi:hypothetical protein
MPILTPSMLFCHAREGGHPESLARSEPLDSRLVILSAAAGGVERRGNDSGET